MADIDWLPDHHLSVAATLAHVDEIIASVGELLFHYQARNGDIVGLREEVDGHLRHLVVETLSPIPAKTPLLAADALNALRAALEHTLCIEAETAAEGNLDEKTARLVEMPAATTHDNFAEWTRKRAKNGPAALQPGADLHSRIYNLQPLHHPTDPAAHPLARLVSYTNHAKHRTPAVTAVQVPVVARRDLPPPFSHSPPNIPDGPIQPGQVVVSVPAGRPVEVALFPTVGINLPGTSRWPVLINELGDIAAWVRIQAIPRLVTGGEPPAPPLPARYEICRGHADVRAALATGTHTTAVERSSERLTETHLRVELAETIAAAPNATSGGRSRLA